MFELYGTGMKTQQLKKKKVTYTVIQSITSSEMCALLLTHPRAHTHVGFYGLRGLSIGVMVFILYKLYVLVPYTYHNT